ncbi:MAG: hypothetical protein KGL43_19170 [Burkholderiales bacterium]|nr:hypothetical protein [Burkholderiales bacterium]MDE2395064.1 hypothetical protein [Burkholderiales bacterium]MDE2455715.1 hypothetical protein [Burkholderiales bacterium]
MHFSATGIPALLLQLGFIVVFAAPVWIAARVVGARHPSLLRSIGALVLGVILAFLSLLLAGPWALLLAPLSFLVAFSRVLGTSFGGAVVVALIVIAGYAAMLHFLGPGIPVIDQGIAV